jgi:aminopeptidase YwaD
MIINKIDSSIKGTTFYIFSFFLFFTSTGYSQDSLYARRVINTLTSDRYHGRGYVKNGDGKAADFIAAEYKRLNLQSFGKNYFQQFSFDVNTFPGKMQVKVDGKILKPGRDYIVYPSSSSSHWKYRLSNSYSLSTIMTDKTGNPCVMISNSDFNASREEYIDWLEKNTQGAVVLVEENKLTWSVGRSQVNIPVIIVLKKSLPDNAGMISMKIKSVFKEQHETQNVIGYIKGKSNPDSFIVFTAHYDHLGRMGKKAIFPGANDNASGVSMLLNLASHYSKKENQPSCSMMFIAFAGEEAGLVGSKFYTENPLFDLAKIKFLINLDLLGTGDDGMTVVNATEFKSQFSLLKSINDEQHYLPMIGERGKARNSDHYYFSEKGVPAFFMYTLGGIKAYHDIDDIAATLPLTRYKEVFRLIRDFADKLQ